MRSRSIALFILSLLIGLSPLAAEEPGSSTGYTRHVAVLIFEGVELLDFAGPAEVLEIAGRFARQGEEPAFELYTVAAEEAPVVSQNFLTLVPDHTFDTAPRPDLLVVPGGGIHGVLGDAELMDWVDATIESTLTLTVCNGAAIAATLGHLDGKEATTWYNALPSMQGRYPEVSFQPGRRFVDSGSIVTTAGVSSGIDGALHLVARLLGRQVAEDTAQYLEYRWAPEPYLIAEYSHLNPSLDDAARRRQQADLWRREGSNDLAERAYRRLLEDDPEDAGLSYDLGAVLAAREDYEGAIDAYLAAAQSPERRANARYNAACAAAQSGQPERALGLLEEAIEAGFSSFRYMDQDPDLEALREDPRYRPRFEALLDRP